MANASESHQPTEPSHGDSPQNTEPSPSSVFKFLTYGLSLPERALRSTSGMVGGAVKESASYLVPMAFRNSRSYKAFVGQMLEFMVNDVGGVPRTEEQLKQNPQVENYVARKSVSSFIDLAGMATLHISPLIVMAVISDVAHGSNHYLKEVTDELKKEGIVSADANVESTSDLLEVVGRAAGATADALDTPPLSIDGLKETITQIRDSLDQPNTPLMDEDEIRHTWTEMKDQAKQQGVSLFGLSSAVTMATLNSLSAVANGALTTVRVSGNMFDQHILQQYRTSLKEIGSRGIYTVVSESSKPYVDAMWKNFSSERGTITEDLLSGKLIGQAWSGMRGWLKGNDPAKEQPREGTSNNQDSANSNGDSAGDS